MASNSGFLTGSHSFSKHLTSVCTVSHVMPGVKGTEMPKTFPVIEIIVGPSYTVGGNVN